MGFGNRIRFRSPSFKGGTMKKIISVFLALVIGFTSLCVNSSAASYKVKISATYKSGYTYVTLTPSSGTVYYTIDGTKADKNDKKYSGKKIKITEPTTLRLTVYSKGKAVKSYSSKIAVRTTNPTVTSKLTSDEKYKLTFSAAEGATIYYTVNGGTPSKSKGEKLGSSKTITVNPGDVVRAVAYKSGWKASQVIKKTMPEIQKKKTKEEEFVDEVLLLINKERRKYGLDELEMDDTFREIGAVRAKEASQKFGHIRPDGRSGLSVFDDFNVKCGAKGENVAAGQQTPKAVVSAWMNSEGHRENILNPAYKKIAIGYYFKSNDVYRHYWVQVFAG